MRWITQGHWPDGLMVEHPPPTEEDMLRARMMWRLADILNALANHAARHHHDRRDHEWGGRRWFT